MSSFDEWCTEIISDCWEMMDADEIAHQAYNAGMERAADMLDLNYPLCAKWIRKEITCTKEEK